MIQHSVQREAVFIDGRSRPRAVRNPFASAATVPKLPLTSCPNTKTTESPPTHQGIVSQWYHFAYRLKKIRLCSTFRWVFIADIPPPLNSETFCHSFALLTYSSWSPTRTSWDSQSMSS